VCVLRVIHAGAQGLPPAALGCCFLGFSALVRTASDVCLLLRRALLAGFLLSRPTITCHVNLPWPTRLHGTLLPCWHKQHLRVVSGVVRVGRRFASWSINCGKHRTFVCGRVCVRVCVSLFLSLRSSYPHAPRMTGPHVHAPDNSFGTFPLTL